MDKGKSHLVAMLLAVVALTTIAASARVVVFTEPASDAGQTLATAAITGLAGGGSGTLTGIAGTVDTAADADLYLFTVNGTVTFTASAVGGTSSVTGNGQIDTSLFLLNSAGVPLVANDDQSNSNYQGAFTVSLTAGTCYLGIALSGNEPINANGQLLFTWTSPRPAYAGLLPA